MLKFERVFVTIKAVKNGNRPIAQIDLLDFAVSEINMPQDLAHRIDRPEHQSVKTRPRSRGAKIFAKLDMPSADAFAPFIVLRIRRKHNCHPPTHPELLAFGMRQRVFGHSRQPGAVDEANRLPESVL